MRTNKEKIKKAAVYGGAAIAVILLFFVGLYGSVYLGLWGKLPTRAELSDLSRAEASLLYDKDEKLIGKYYITDRESIVYEEFPEPLIQALIATEDARFNKHKGVDNTSLVRVFFKSVLLRDKSAGGGSTLTLQLAKNIYGRKQYRILGLVVNKFRESIIARRLEKVYSKKEILTLYLNTVPFSGDTYGIESAAQKFFSVKTKELTLEQAATLVGSLKANHTYNPRLFPERSQLRRDVVIQQMLKYDYLTQAEAAAILNTPLELNYQSYSSGSGLAPYFREWIRKELEKILTQEEFLKEDGSPYRLKEDGLRIYTTLDAGLQAYAEEAVEKRMSELQAQLEKYYGNHPPWRTDGPLIQSELKKLKVYQKLKTKGWDEEQIMDSLNQPKRTELFTWEGNEVKNSSILDSLSHYIKFLNTGFVALHPHTGAVQAYVGGIDYRYFQYDHITQSRRQVGSVFKPFVYTAALEKGWSPCAYFPVHEVTYTDQKNWTPKNANQNIDPDLNYSLAEALTQSLNTISVKILREIGIQPAIEQVHKMGITDPIENKPSMALGISNLRLLDIALAYSTYLNEGNPVTPYFIKRIEDKNGNAIAEFKPQLNPNKAFSPQTQQEMLEILKNVVNRGTASRLRSVYGFSNAIAGKTGTTQDNTDGWFVGLLPNLVTVTWVGNDNSKIKFPTTGLGQGAHSALPIFAEFLKRMNQDAAYSEYTQAQFKRASSAVMQEMNCEPTSEDGFFKKLFEKRRTEMPFDKALDDYEENSDETDAEQLREERKRERLEKREERRQERQERREERKKNDKGIFRKLFGKKKS